MEICAKIASKERLTLDSQFHVSVKITCQLKELIFYKMVIKGE